LPEARQGDSFIIKEDGEPFGAYLLMALIDKGEVIDPISVDLVCQKKTISFLVKNCIRAAQRQVEPSARRKLDFSKSGVPTLVAGDATSNVDKEKQSTTGYLKGTPLGASGGHTVFTMDNAKGGSDAVGSLYLNGSKPAARSMYVKAGESFKAQGLAAGSYVFRYRFVGSEETYEVDRQVLLTESQSETGVRYSKITITLYKETGGNLTVKRVSPDDF
jgi:hypothetical protein